MLNGDAGCARRLARKGVFRWCRSGRGRRHARGPAQSPRIEQWTAVHGIPATPARTDRDGRVTRYSYTDSAGVTHVESVLVEGLAHAFPIRPEGIPPCGQPSDYVVSAGVCAAQEIARFWGLSDDN